MDFRFSILILISLLFVPFLSFVPSPIFRYRFLGCTSGWQEIYPYTFALVMSSNYKGLQAKHGDACHRHRYLYLPIIKQHCMHRIQNATHR